jgi:hypothetical protein
MTLKTIPNCAYLKITLDGKKHSSGLDLTLNWSLLRKGDDLRIKGTLVSRKTKVVTVAGKEMSTAELPLKRLTTPVYVTAFRTEGLGMEVDLNSDGETIESDEPAEPA